MGNANNCIDKQNTCAKYLDPFPIIHFSELPAARRDSGTMDSKHAHSSLCSHGPQDMRQLMRSDTVVNVKRKRAFGMDCIITSSS